jgi:hypothetical protein
MEEQNKKKTNKAKGAEKAISAIVACATHNIIQMIEKRDDF